MHLQVVKNNNNILNNMTEILVNIFIKYKFENELFNRKYCLFTY